MSHDYIAHLLKEGGFETVPCKNAYEANELLPIDEVRGFFKKVRDVIDHYHIKDQNVWIVDESWVSPEDKAPRCYVPRATPYRRKSTPPILTRHLYHHTPLVEYILKHLYMYPRTLVFGSWDIIQTYHRPYVHICMHMHTYGYTCVHMHADARPLPHPRLTLHAYVCICIHMSAYACRCVHMHTH